MDVDNRAVGGIDEKGRLDGLYISITLLEIVVRRFSAVKVGGVDGSVTGLIEQLRRESEQLSSSRHWSSVEGFAQCRWTRELAALVDERSSDPLHLLGPVEDFEERRFHVKP